MSRRRASGLLGLLGLLTAALASACRSQISLGDPDGGVMTPAPALGVARCTGAPSRAVVTVAEASFGDFRGMVASHGTIHALFARPTGEGILARVPATGGVLAAIARVGLDPSSIAVSPSGSLVFVAARGSAQVFRVDAASAVIVAEAPGGPAAVVDDGHAGAFWTLPSSDTVFGFDFASAAPKALVTFARPLSLVRAANTLYIGGSHVLSAYELGQDAAPRTIADRCGEGAPAVDEQTLYCADQGTIVRVDLSSGVAAPVAMAQSGARDLVVGAGRVFWRATPTPARTLVMALPLDGIGGPTLLESGGAGPLMLAIDGCDLYFTVGRAIVRRGL